MKAYLKNKSDIFAELGSSENGLSSEEAERRIARDGKNKLAEGKKTTLLQRLLAQFADPMIIILLVAALISGITAAYAGDSFTDVIIILAVVIINAVLGVVQESKAEAAIAALAEMTAATSKVLRDGHQVTVKSDELAVGDVIILEAGDSVPADARILTSASLKCEEAALTGESVPVDKDDRELTEAASEIPLGDRKNMVYMGSTAVYGRATAIITDIGMQTEMGKIANALTMAEDKATPLQRKLNQLSKILSILVLGICAVVFAIDMLRSDTITFASALDTFMIAVSLAVAAIPEGLAAVVTIVLSIGVTNMSKRNAVIRKLTAVETLGCAQIICSDKTGTLTQNKMTVVEAFSYDKTILATAMALASDAKLDIPDAVGKRNAMGESTECALVNYAYSIGLEKDSLEEASPRVGEIPFDSTRKMMSTIHELGDGSLRQYTKGAPDEVIKLCTHRLKDGKPVKMTDADRREILSQNKRMADSALRVLAAATRELQAMPDTLSAEKLECELCFIGLCGMIDPVREEVKPAIEECRAAGIRPIMITGDHKDTAAAIAMQLGIIDSPDEAVTGADIDTLSDVELDECIDKYSVYARVKPEHKVRIVNAWRHRGKITAMTGDGVNDAPSIKNADIGIGMGITGTDVTKNVADMVLADDNFATIVSAVEEGRRIYDNIRKSIQFLLSSNLSEVLSIFAATMLGFTILKPVHLLWINLITDCLPALALGMEKAEDDIMKKPPRDSRDGIFSNGLGIDVIWQGALTTLITLAAYFIGHYMESGVWEITESSDGMTMAFLVLSMAEVFHSFNMRSRTGSIFKIKSQNFVLWGAMLLSLLLTAAVIYIPVLSTAFEFEAISFAEYAVALALAISIIPIVEIVKLIRRKLQK